MTELHAARRSGALLSGDVDVNDLLRQLAILTPPHDARAARDLEWYALWQTASALARDGYHELKSIFEARCDDGGPLLVSLVAAFIPFEVGIEGHSQTLDLGVSILPVDHIRWLCEHSEPVEVLLNDAVRGSSGTNDQPKALIDELAGRLRIGLAYAQQGEYERAIVEFSAVVQSDPTRAAAYVYRGDALRLKGEYDRALNDYTQALRLHPTGHPLHR